MSRYRPDFHTCECGKLGYHSRRDAARQRRGHPDRTHLGLYRCRTSGAWHLGHRPDALNAGRITRDQLP